MLSIESVFVIDGFKYIKSTIIKRKILNMKIDLNCLETKNHLYANSAVTDIAIETNQKSWSGYEKVGQSTALIS